MEYKLTESQQKAIHHFSGPAIVIAGPGSGKTSVIIERVVFLIDKKSVRPENILVTTFTDKATDELKYRLAGRIKQKAGQIQISTIHSFCMQMLEEYSLFHEYGASFEVLSSEEQKLFINVNLSRLDVFTALKGRYNFFNTTQEDELAGFYNFLTANSVDPDTLIKDLNKKGVLDDGSRKIIESYKIYLDLLKREKKIDFDGLQLEFFNMIDKNKTVLEELRNRFQYLLVDEYQDTSPLQDRIFRLIAAPENNIFVVGDVNQSIYGFRGASAKNFWNFKNNYKNADEYVLNVNFRSKGNIVDAANRLSEGMIKQVLEAKRGAGNRLLLLHGDTRDDMAQKAVNLIKKMKEKGTVHSYGDVALIFRKKKTEEDYIHHFKREDIPIVTFGGGSLFDREEIRALINILRYLLKDYIDNEGKLKKWTDWWSIDQFDNDVLALHPDTIDILKSLSQDKQIADIIGPAGLTKAGLKNKNDIDKIIKLNKLRIEIKDKDSKKEQIIYLNIIYKILETSGYLTRLLEDESNNNREILYNLAELTRIAGRYEESHPRFNPMKFMFFLHENDKTGSYNQIMKEEAGSVKLMTAHKAKGLEFPAVFLCNMNMGDYPLKARPGREFLKIHVDPKLCLDPAIMDEAERNEEELRVFYVALTRAQDILTFNQPEKIKVKSVRPSPFLELIRPCLTEETGFKEKAEEKYILPDEISNVSYSSLSIYDNCPFLYKLLYQYGFVIPALYPQKWGNIAHNVIQRVNMELKQKKTLKEKDILSFIDEQWIPLHTLPKKEEEDKKNMAVLLMNYYSYARENFKEILSIEKPFNYIGDKVIIKGKVDAVVRDKNDKVKLIDYKSRVEKGIELTNVGFQLNLYHYCLGRKDIDSLAAYTLMDNKENILEKDEGSVKKAIEDITRSIHENKFEKKKQASSCKECIFKFVCE